MMTLRAEIEHLDFEPEAPSAIFEVIGSIR
jgi:hypothetical protein